MNILGLDLSLNATGLAFLSPSQFIPPGCDPEKSQKGRAVTYAPGLGYQGLVIHPPDGTLARWKFITDTIMDYAEHANLVIVEGYAFSSNASYARAGAELKGIVLFHLLHAGLTPLEVAPTALKKFITGKGGSDKNIVLKEVFRRWNLDLCDDNMADAFGLAKIGEAMVMGTAGLTAYQVEVIEALKKPPSKPKKLRGVA